jgi:hypothetical protein
LFQPRRPAPLPAANAKDRSNDLLACCPLRRDRPFRRRRRLLLACGGGALRLSADWGGGGHNAEHHRSPAGAARSRPAGAGRAGGGGLRRAPSPCAAYRVSPTHCDGSRRGHRRLLGPACTGAACASPGARRGLRRQPAGRSSGAPGHRGRLREDDGGSRRPRDRGHDRRPGRGRRSRTHPFRRPTHRRRSPLADRRSARGLARCADRRARWALGHLEASDGRLRDPGAGSLGGTVLRRAGRRVRGGGWRKALRFSALHPQIRAR